MRLTVSKFVATGRCGKHALPRYRSSDIWASAGAPPLRIGWPDISMSEDRTPSGGAHFASKTNTQMSSGIGLRRLYYKAFAEANLPA
jgi:hypothetical protein